jgi:hypothetical protein
VGRTVNTVQMVPALRDLYSKQPEYWHHEPWELQHVLFSVGYSDDLADEAAIDAATWVAQEDVLLLAASPKTENLVKEASWSAQRIWLSPGPTRPGGLRHDALSFLSVTAN